MRKEFNVEWDSYEECNKLLLQLKSRVSQLRTVHDPEFIPKNEKVRRVYEACHRIYNTDISSVYENIQLDDSKSYYVYAHCDPGFKIALKKEGKSTFGATLGLSYMPFYIGKGTGDRAWDLDRNDSHRKVRQKIKTFNNDVIVTIIKDTLTEKEALMYESKLIDIFGLRSFNGRLVNLDEGINSKDRRMMYADDLRELNTFYKHSV